MDMRKIIMLVTGFLLTSGKAAMEEDLSKFDLEQADYIALCTAGWDAEFYRNGSAKLKGSVVDSLYIAYAPKGSFVFEKVYKSLLPHLGGKERTGMVFILVTDPRTSKGSRIVNTEKSRAAVRKLMFRLRDKAAPINKMAFEEMYSKYPFVKGDEPTPYSYKNFKPGLFSAASKDAGDPVNWKWKKKWREAYEAEMKRLYAIEQGEHEPAPASADGPTPETPGTDTTGKETPVESAVAGEADADETPAPPARAWLYGGILAALCAGATLFFCSSAKRSAL